MEIVPGMPGRRSFKSRPRACGDSQREGINVLTEKRYVPLVADKEEAGVIEIKRDK